MRNPSSPYITKLKTAKWLFAIAVLLFVSKPFIGFALNPSTTLSEASILVKSFTKRKHEYVENSSYDIKTIQRKLADPVDQLMVLFAALLAIILPRISNLTGGSFTLLFRRLKLSPQQVPLLWLSNSQLLI